jgi:uncharacterized membrane protein
VRKFIAIAFPGEAEAYEGVRALEELARDRQIRLCTALVIEREMDGSITARRSSERPFRRAWIGALVGAIAGMLAGPGGAVFGLAVGGFVGAIADTMRWSLREEHVRDIGNLLAPGAYAVIAEIREKWTRPLDDRMAALGARVLRQTGAAIVGDIVDRHGRNHRAGAAAERVERDTEQAGRKELFFEADLHDMRVKLRDTAETVRSQLVKTRLDLDDRIRKLDERIAMASPETRHDLEQRVADIKENLVERGRKLTHALELADEALRRY